MPRVSGREIVAATVSGLVTLQLMVVALAAVAFALRYIVVNGEYVCLPAVAVFTFPAFGYAGWHLWAVSRTLRGRADAAKEWMPILFVQTLLAAVVGPLVLAAVLRGGIRIDWRNLTAPAQATTFGGCLLVWLDAVALIVAAALNWRSLALRPPEERP